jgi:hypothetical protein
VTINPADAAVTDVNPAVAGTDEQSIAFAPDGTLYAGRGTLRRIDPVTAVETTIGSDGGFDIRGLEFVPEPTGAALLGPLLLGALIRRGKRRSH